MCCSSDCISGSPPCRKLPLATGQWEHAISSYPRTCWVVHVPLNWGSNLLKVLGMLLNALKLVETKFWFLIWINTHQKITLFSALKYSRSTQVQMLVMHSSHQASCWIISIQDHLTSKLHIIQVTCSGDIQKGIVTFRQLISVILLSIFGLRA